MSETTTMTITARFEISRWEETELPNLPGDVAYGAKMQKTFTEGIDGSSEGLFIASGQDEGNRAYVGIERITGALPDGRSGSFTIHHGGLESNPDTWFGHIVPGTGSGDLDGIAGSARIEHDEAGAYFTLTLRS